MPGSHTSSIKNELSPTQQAKIEENWKHKNAFHTVANLIGYCCSALNIHRAFLGPSIIFLPSCVGFLDYMLSYCQEEQILKGSQRIKFREWIELFMVILLDDISSLLIENSPKTNIRGLRVGKTDLTFKGQKRYDMYVSIANISKNSTGILVTGEWFFATYLYCLDNFMDYKANKFTRTTPFLQHLKKLKGESFYGSLTTTSQT
jgi:hypothetical protein